MGLGVLGLLVGSFLNVVIARWPRMMERQWWADVGAQLQDREGFERTFGQPAPEVLNEAHVALQAVEASPPGMRRLGLARPRSHCPACGHTLRWHENIPLLSWLVLRGRCSACGAPISWQYPLVEATCAALFVAVGWHWGATPVALLWCGWAAVLLAAAVIDWRTTLLPDALTQPLLWAGLLAAALGWTLHLSTALAGACAGYLSLWTVHRVFLWATGREGMGQGDFKLLAALGAWLGWQALLPVVLWGAVAGALVGLVMQRLGTLRDGLYVPFGPFLAASALGVMLIGPQQALAMVFSLGALLGFGGGL